MREEGVAKITHHELANRRGEPRLRKADASVDHGDENHEPRIERKESDVFLGYRLIDEQLEEVGVR